MEKIQKYARVIRLFKEPCLSGLRYIFAKDAGALKPLEGSNPSGSASWEMKSLVRPIKYRGNPGTCIFHNI